MLETQTAPPASAAEVNEAIRRFVAGRTAWSPEELAELDRLRAAWAAAVRAETVQAAWLRSAIPRGSPRRR